MKAKSIGIGALATELKIGNGSVQKMRAGKGNVELGSVGKVARRLGKTAAELLSPDPAAAAIGRYRDLNALEGRLVDLFREVTDEHAQLDLLTAFNKLVTDAGFGNGASNPFRNAPAPGPAKASKKSKT